MAGRYATALFELALEDKAVDAVRQDLDQFDALTAANPDLARLVRSPVFLDAMKTEEHQLALGKLLAQMKSTDTKVARSKR